MRLTLHHSGAHTALAAAHGWRVERADLERFAAFVDVLPCGCWFYTGARSRGAGNRKWYGSFWVRLVRGGGTAVRAHKFAAVVLGAGHTPGNHQDHDCCFSLCVNPAHLTDVTPQVNQERKIARLRAEADRLEAAVRRVA